MRKIKIIQIGLPIALALAGLLSMSLIAYFLKNGSISSWKISPYEIVNITFTLQLIVLPISFIALAIMYLHDKAKFKTFFRPGFRKNNWHLYGLAIAIAFTAGNALLMSVGVMAENGSVNKTFYSLIPLVIIFAATNAWSEEIFSRFVIVA